MDEAGVDFADIVKEMARQNGMSTVEMAQHYATLGVKYGDTLALIEAAGRTSVNATLAALNRLKAQAAAVQASMGSGGGGGGTQTLDQAFARRGGPRNTTTVVNPAAKGGDMMRSFGYSMNSGMYTVYARSKSQADQIWRAYKQAQGLGGAGNAKQAQGLVESAGNAERAAALQAEIAELQNAERAAALQAEIAELTAGTAVDTGPSKVWGQGPELGAIAGDKLAEGGIIPATPGGRIIRAAEAGQSEAIIPLAKLPDLMSRMMGGGNGGRPQITIMGDVYGWDDWVDKVGEANIEIEERGG